MGSTHTDISSILLGRLIPCWRETVRQFNSTKLYNNGTNSFIIDISGNVGIGITNPSNLLQVGGAGRLKITSGITEYTVSSLENCMLMQTLSNYSSSKRCAWQDILIDSIKVVRVVF